MNARVSCHFLSIMLLCLPLCSAVSKGGKTEGLKDWLHGCFGPKGAEPAVTEGDFKDVAEFFSSPSPSPIRKIEPFKPKDTDRAQIMGIVKRDAKTNRSVQFESPSFRERIESLAKQTAPVADRIQTSLAQEVGKVPPTHVPMSKSFLEQTMKLSKEKIAYIEARTKNNRNELYAEKLIRLTADLFSAVCTGEDEEALGTWISSPRPIADFSREQQIIEPVEDQINKYIMPSGIFVDKDRGYLAAVPDGLVDKNGIFKMLVLNRPGRDKNRYKFKKAKELTPGKPLYYEIQGMLAITGKAICYLVIVTKDTMQHVTVIRDEEFWQNEMVEKLDNFFFNILQPWLSNDKLPIINDIRIAAAILHVATSEISDKDMKDITQKTKGRKGFDTLRRQSRMRLFAKDFFLIMDKKKLMKEKVIEILQNVYRRRNIKEWKSEQDFKAAIVIRFANKHNYDVTMGGLIIDRTNRFLAAHPTAFGYRKVQPSRKDTIAPGVNGEQSEQVEGQSARPAQRGNTGGMFGGLFNKKKSVKVNAPAPTVPTPGRVLKKVTTFGRNKSPEMDKPEAVLFEVVTPKELEAAKGLPPGYGVDSASKGTRNYYKIQGSLAISRAKTCIFMVAHPGRKEYVEKIEFDPEVWAEMLDALKHFYYSVYLIHQASPEEFDKMFRGPTLADLLDWQTDLSDSDR